MSSFEKLVTKLLSKQNNVPIGDIRRLLEGFNYKEKGNPGSECIFHKKGSFPINVPTVKGRTVKSCYVKKIIKYLELEEWVGKNIGRE